eukprot:TRINITY_DN2199_c4_g4_i1.p1 TRINITY_DN2199_c4_g4~~TRINITY_DN2199_c4_g4_i1.p1  ORF type:complete len:884 (+),score=205.60 TRINITY_DN2199_c4_g4_i1:42-2654(+)
MAMAVASHSRAGGAGAPQVPDAFKAGDADFATLHYELARERTELQRTSQMIRAREEDLQKRERQAVSIKEHRLQFERNQAELKGKLVRVEAESKREILALRGRLAACEAQRERERAAHERELAVLEDSRRQLAACREQEGKEREALLHDLHEQRQELISVQQRLRETEAELQKQRVEFTAQLEGRRRRLLRSGSREHHERQLCEYEGAAASLVAGSGVCAGGTESAVRSSPRTSTAAVAVSALGEGSGIADTSSSQDDLSQSQSLTANAGLAAAAVSKMRALEEQLQAWQSGITGSTTLASAPELSSLERSSFSSATQEIRRCQAHSRGSARSWYAEGGPLDGDQGRQQLPEEEEGRRGAMQREQSSAQSCANCGNALLFDSMFCRFCGQKKQEWVETARRRTVAEDSAVGTSYATATSTLVSSHAKQGRAASTDATVEASARRCREAELQAEFEAERAKACAHRIEAFGAAQRAAAQQARKATASACCSVETPSNQPSLVPPPVHSSSYQQLPSQTLDSQASLGATSMAGYAPTGGCRLTHSSSGAQLLSASASQEYLAAAAAATAGTGGRCPSHSPDGCGALPARGSCIAAPSLPLSSEQVLLSASPSVEALSASGRGANGGTAGCQAAPSLQHSSRAASSLDSPRSPRSSRGQQLQLQQQQQQQPQQGLEQKQQEDRFTHLSQQVLNHPQHKEQQLCTEQLSHIQHQQAWQQAKSPMHRHQLMHSQQELQQALQSQRHQQQRPQQHQQLQQRHQQDHPLHQHQALHAVYHQESPYDPRSPHCYLATHIDQHGMYEAKQLSAINKDMQPLAQQLAHNFHILQTCQLQQGLQQCQMLRHALSADALYCKIEDAYFLMQPTPMLAARVVA